MTSLPTFRPVLAVVLSVAIVPGADGLRAGDGAGAADPAAGSAISREASNMAPENRPSSTAASPLPALKEPQKEKKGARKKRFLRTPAGIILLVVAGAVVAGGIARASLGDRNPAPSP